MSLFFRDLQLADTSKLGYIFYYQIGYALWEGLLDTVLKTFLPVCDAKEEVPDGTSSFPYARILTELLTSFFSQGT